MKYLKAEMWDKMQYLFRNYYDRMIHGVLYFDKPLNVEAVKNILIGFTEKIPVLHSSFVDNPIRPFWKVQSYHIEDILTVTESGNVDEDVEKFICGNIPVTSNVQYRVGLFNGNGKTAFAMIVNHMCFDGGDFKYFLYKFAYNYNKYLTGEKTVEVKTGSRSYKAVYTKLNEEDKKTAKGLYKNISVVKDKHCFPLTEPREDDQTMIIRRKIDRDTFVAMRDTGKKLDVTVNDVMLAVYIRALYEIGRFDENETLTIPCMVDLRRHIDGGGEFGGMTNHTGFMQCSVKRKGETVNDTLIEIIRSVKISKRDKFIGLYSLPLLKLAYTVFPQFLSEFAIKIGYLNPLIGMSNIGRLDGDKLKMGDAVVTDGFITGAVKYKPYMQLALTTLDDVVTMSVAIRANYEDETTVNKFFDYIMDNIHEFIGQNNP